ncbi:MAG: hypothetical protein PVF57_13960 [Pseudomonadales bacterium]|jgi:hypothetical protein
MLQALTADRERQNASQSTAETLSDEDRAKVAAFARAQFQHCENMHFQFESGQLDSEFFNSRFENEVRRFAPFWANHEVLHGRPSFEAYISELQNRPGR